MCDKCKGRGYVGPFSSGKRFRQCIACRGKRVQSEADKARNAAYWARRASAEQAVRVARRYTHVEPLDWI
jgi:hypothetical protein